MQWEFWPEIVNTYNTLIELICDREKVLELYMYELFSILYMHFKVV